MLAIIRQSNMAAKHFSVLIESLEILPWLLSMIPIIELKRRPTGRLPIFPYWGLPPAALGPSWWGRGVTTVIPQPVGRKAGR